MLSGTPFRISFPNKDNGYKDSTGAGSLFGLGTTTTPQLTSKISGTTLTSTNSATPQMNYLPPNPTVRQLISVIPEWCGRFEIIEQKIREQEDLLIDISVRFKTLKKLNSKTIMNYEKQQQLSLSLASQVAKCDRSIDKERPRISLDRHICKELLHYTEKFFNLNGCVLNSNDKGKNKQNSESNEMLYRNLCTRLPAPIYLTSYFLQNLLMLVIDKYNCLNLLENDFHLLKNYDKGQKIKLIPKIMANHYNFLVYNELLACKLEETFVKVNDLYQKNFNKSSTNSYTAVTIPLGDANLKNLSNTTSTLLSRSSDVSSQSSAFGGMLSQTTPSFSNSYNWSGSSSLGSSLNPLFQTSNALNSNNFFGNKSNINTGLFGMSANKIGDGGFFTGTGSIFAPQTGSSISLSNTVNLFGSTGSKPSVDASTSNLFGGAGGNSLFTTNYNMSNSIIGGVTGNAMTGSLFGCDPNSSARIGNIFGSGTSTTASSSSLFSNMFNATSTNSISSFANIATNFGASASGGTGVGNNSIFGGVNSSGILGSGSGNLLAGTNPGFNSNTGSNLLGSGGGLFGGNSGIGDQIFSSGLSSNSSSMFGRGTGGLFGSTQNSSLFCGSSASGLSSGFLANTNKSLFGSSTLSGGPFGDFFNTGRNATQ